MFQSSKKCHFGLTSEASHGAPCRWKILEKFAKHSKICLICATKVKNGQNQCQNGENPKFQKLEKSMGKFTWELSKKIHFFGFLDSDHFCIDFDHFWPLVRKLDIISYALQFFPEFFTDRGRRGQLLKKAGKGTFWNFGVKNNIFSAVRFFSNFGISFCTIRWT